MSFSSDFVRIAHRRAIWSSIQQILLDRYVNGDSPAKEQLVCEEVPFSSKEVSQEALLEVLERLEHLGQEEQFQLSQFEFRRRDARPALSPQQAHQETSSGERRKKKKRPKRPAGDPGESGAGAPGGAGSGGEPTG